MKNTLVSVLEKFLRLCANVLFSHDPFSKILTHATLETFTAYARPYTEKYPLPLPHVYVLYFYRDPFVQNAIHAAKYRNRKDLCILFGELLWHTFGEELSHQSIMLGTPWVVVPIPLSKQHRRVRGYNQTEKIAEGFLKYTDASAFTLLNEALCMASAHKKQTHAIRKSERIHNIVDSFTLPDSNLVRGKNILLIDDVLTTGATLQEASRTLRAGGARHIYCLVIAH
ncbi:MAG: phosphoribosyltransferase family protein [Candidatus Campbellbacteria bacterium]|nr:phosphoribosyltransferase family protein [Candidatus Campbellbacteria bacterium]